MQSLVEFSTEYPEQLIFCQLLVRLQSCVLFLMLCWDVPLDSLLHPCRIFLEIVVLHINLYPSCSTILIWIIDRVCCLLLPIKLYNLTDCCCSRFILHRVTKILYLFTVMIGNDIIDVILFPGNKVNILNVQFLQVIWTINVEQTRTSIDSFYIEDIVPLSECRYLMNRWNLKLFVENLIEKISGNQKITAFVPKLSKHPLYLCVLPGEGGLSIIIALTTG